MTEAEWLASADPRAMLRFLCGKASDRKLRLFAVALLQAGPPGSDREYLRRLEIAARFADGLIPRKVLRKHWPTAGRQASWPERASEWSQAVLAGELGPRPHVASVVSVSRLLLRDIFGNPFRRATVLPSWRTATVTALAEASYAERGIDRLPILGDALEDAGCTDTAILDHLRGPGPHVRGCWALDLLLGKQ
jgi:hypothetical protein